MEFIDIVYIVLGQCSCGIYWHRIHRIRSL